MTYDKLPQPVLDRLGDRVPVTTLEGRAAELRPALGVEVRSDADGAPVLSGYATVYGYAYDVAGGPAAGGWSEVIARGACAKSLQERDDVRLLANHDGLPLARTKSGTLTLTEDEHGLLCEARLGSSSLASDVVDAMRRGDLDEMSFAFRAIRQEWNDDYTERRITEVQLFDVSVVTYPANPATVTMLRDADPVVELVARSSAMPLGLAQAQAEALRFG